MVSGVARLTTRLVAKLAERGVGLVLDRIGRGGAATAVVAARADRALRLAQYDVLFDISRSATTSCWCWDFRWDFLPRDRLAPWERF